MRFFTTVYDFIESFIYATSLEQNVNYKQKRLSGGYAAITSSFRYVI